MALTNDKKQIVVQQVSELLATSKMTVVAKYDGTPVKAMQDLRRSGKENGTTIKVVKNRLVKKALAGTDNMKDADAAALSGMLMYAFNSEDEVAAAQTLANFAKTQPTISFVGAFAQDGRFLSAEEVTTLSALPSKSDLIAQVLATLDAPLHGVVNALGGNLHALLDGLQSRASN